MRSTRAGDHWRHVYEKAYRFKIVNLDFVNLRGLGDGRVSFNGGITAICGQNGAGKSTLLRAIAGALTKTINHVQGNCELTLKLDGTEIIAQLILEGKEAIRKISIQGENLCVDPQELPVETEWIEVFHQVHDLTSFYNQPNFMDLLEAAGSRPASQTELDDLSYVVGRRYESIDIYELEHPVYDYVPYFKVVAGGVEYGAEAMGLGEFAACYILWHLKRISKDSIVLIEEPETFLAPRSQQALLNVIARISDERRIWVIITTHSPGILNCMPPVHVRVLSRSSSTVRITTPRTRAEYLPSLGVSIQKKGIVFVEDRIAREFAICWLGYFDATIVQEYEFVWVGSKEKLISQLMNIPNERIRDWLAIVGLFDGDQRGLVTEAYNWPYGFLPGVEPPEKLLMHSAYDCKDHLARALGRHVEVVERALSALEGLDYHDWVLELPKQIGSQFEHCIAGLFDVWIEGEYGFATAKEAFNEFKATLDGVPLQSL